MSGTRAHLRPRAPVRRADQSWAMVRTHFESSRSASTRTSPTKPGVEVIGEHDELGERAGRHEELYFVVGRPRDVHGQRRRDRRAGRHVRLRPRPGREAEGRREGSRHDGLHRRRQAGRGVHAVAVGAERRGLRPLRRARTTTRPPRRYERLLAETPDDAGFLYNLACAESRTGTQGARRSTTSGRRSRSTRDFKESAPSDPDFDAIRDEPGVLSDHRAGGLRRRGLVARAPGPPRAARPASPLRSRLPRARRRAAAARSRARTPCAPARRRTERAPPATPLPASTSPYVTAPIETSATIGLPSELGIAIASGFVPASGSPPSGWGSRAGDVAVSAATRPPSASLRTQCPSIPVGKQCDGDDHAGLRRAGSRAARGRSRPASGSRARRARPSARTPARRGSRSGRASGRGPGSVVEPLDPRQPVPVPARAPRRRESGRRGRPRPPRKSRAPRAWPGRRRACSLTKSLRSSTRSLHGRGGIVLQRTTKGGVRHAPYEARFLALDRRSPGSCRSRRRNRSLARRPRTCPPPSPRIRRARTAAPARRGGNTFRITNAVWRGTSTSAEARLAGNVVISTRPSSTRRPATAGSPARGAARARRR